MSKEVLETAVAACFERAEARFGRLFKRPGVSLDLRGRAAGQAHMGKGLLRFNKALYQDNRQAFLDEVVPHEVAHWLAWQLHGSRIRPHGIEWQALMVELFGLAPKRTHDFELKERTFTYHCRCRQHQLSVRRHNKVQRGDGQYQCRYCGQQLKAGLKG
ncbi:SprT family zinc-dependent metalloprotease [Gallaecimonas kandeliae]|uniref:SprT family zinc-dependent metalloprotease n=1 Tax=Gallaecimonas kandeliae TaxID=3029055 RepID=UPI002647A2DA|nr:SprT family zinc-dependent metalloprotease [Gallaecimonas kandeliae]WKE65138.1 SprT family zinc-dependent metalloprotease [Gallaecimonas kandeliae]